MANIAPVSRGLAIALCAVGVSTGCGAGSEARPGETMAARATADSMGGAAPSPMMEPTEAYAAESLDEDDSLSIASDSSVPSAPAPAPSARGAGRSGPQLAQAGQTQTTTRSASPPTATDAVGSSTPLLIYTAELHLAVYEVEETQETILSAVAELEGFLAHRSDAHLVVRVPAQHFQAALDAVEASGDVVGRNVQATDVSEEFRDLSIRIRNAEAMRERLEQLLTRAANVQEALAIERELQRLTETIERMKGRQRFLSDRIAFSTITIRFQSRATDPGPSDEFRLPFDWLSELGVTRLVDL